MLCPLLAIANVTHHDTLGLGHLLLIQGSQSTRRAASAPRLPERSSCSGRGRSRFSGRRASPLPIRCSITNPDMPACQATHAGFCMLRRNALTTRILTGAAAGDVRETRAIQTCREHLGSDGRARRSGLTATLVQEHPWPVWPYALTDDLIHDPIASHDTIEVTRSSSIRPCGLFRFLPIGRCKSSRTATMPPCLLPKVP